MNDHIENDDIGTVVARKATMMDAADRRRDRRRRVACLAAVVVTIGFGLASRREPMSALGKYPGDALWAAMIFFAGRAIFPRAAVSRVALAALTFCFAIETLKLYRAPWIVAVRATTLGHLVFGHVFSVANLAAYALGVSLAAAATVAVASVPVTAAHRRRDDGRA